MKFIHRLIPGYYTLNEIRDSPHLLDIQSLPVSLLHPLELAPSKGVVLGNDRTSEPENHCFLVHQYAGIHLRVVRGVSSPLLLPVYERRREIRSRGF